MDVYQYQEALERAVRASDAILACQSHQGTAWEHRYDCSGCARRMGEEIAKIGMTFVRSQLGTPAEAVVRAYRRLKDPQANVHETFLNWDRYLVEHEAGHGAHPQEIRGQRLQKNKEATAALWEALRKLDRKWPATQLTETSETPVKEA